MIEAIRNIGEYALRKNGKNTYMPIEILLDNPSNRSTKGVLFIVLNNKGEEFEYKGIEVEEFSKENLEKYLYKKGSPNGTDVTPTSMITEIEKTFNIKILNWFKNNNNIENDKKEMIQSIYSCLQKNANKIKQDLKENSKTENNIISIKINGKYLGDYDIFKDFLIDKSKETLYIKYGKVSKTENQYCSVCNKKDEVYGFVSTFNFYTLDKPGFVSGGFRQENAWKNYPVCLNCALTLEEGKKYLQEYLNFDFYGFKYLLIPKFIKSLSREIQNNIFKLIEKQKNPKFREKEIKHLTSDEDEILYLMSEQKNYFNNNMLFYSAPKGFNGAVFYILQYIEDILPSRLRKMFEVKEVIDQEEIFKNCIVPIYNKQGKKEGDKPLEFNFGILRTFFPKISNNVTSDKYFLGMVNNIFANKPINYEFLLNYIMQKINEDFINGYSTRINTLKAFMLLNYLYKLKVLKIKEDKRKMENVILPLEIKSEIKEKIEKFFQRFPDFLNSNIKKAIFLEGVLTQFLLNIQYRERKATPFRVKLKGLKLDEDQIRKLLPEIQNKLEEYGKNYYRDLEAIIAYYFVSSGNNWNITNDEISFYFVLGMNLSDLFKKEKENGGNINE